MIEQGILDRYEEAIEWMHSIIVPPARTAPPPQDRTREERMAGQVAGYNRMGLLAEFLGRPQDRFPAVHVGGTGGKGSTTMLIGRILEGVYRRVGVHVNPYLQIPGEKFLINGRIIPPSRFAELVFSFRDRLCAFNARHPDVRIDHRTAQVALTLLYFGESELDVAVFEVGMGGRFDRSNVLNPELSVITNVDYDHLLSLGPELWRIAWHKAGIIKPGTPAITAETKPEALDVIRREAREQGARLYCVGEDYACELVSADARGITVNVQAPYGRYEGLQIPILGPFQGQNAGLAVAAADVLARERGFALSPETVRESLAEFRFPGRMEVMQQAPLAILDGAHNPQKASALAEALQSLYPDRAYTLVFGMLSAKDVEASLQHLLPMSTRFVAVRPQVVGKRTMEASEMAEIVRGMGYRRPIDVYPRVGEALAAVMPEARPDEFVLVTGSLYMLGEARDYWVKPRDLLVDAELGRRYV